MVDAAKTPQSRGSRKTARIIVVGDKVRFRLGIGKVVGKVIEDRGPIGTSGRRLLRVFVRAKSPEESAEIEVPADDTELVPATGS